MWGWRWLELVGISLSAALALGLDACLVILFRFGTLTTGAAALRWAGAVGLTHVLFPMVGLLGGWVLVERYHLAPGVYAVGAILLALLIGSIVREATRPLPSDRALDEGERRARGTILVFWVPVLSVSYDALLAGPGYTVLLRRYPASLAWVSFVAIGLLVGLFALGAGWAARSLHRRCLEGRRRSPGRLGGILTVGVIAELVLFSFFMVWSAGAALSSLKGGAGPEPPLGVVLVGAVMIGGSVSAVFFGRIRSAQTRRAQAAVTRHSLLPSDGVRIPD